MRWRELLVALLQSLDLLRNRVTQAWTAQEAPEVHHICRGFRRALKAVVELQGGYINL